MGLEDHIESVSNEEPEMNMAAYVDVRDLQHLPEVSTYQKTIATAYSVTSHVAAFGMGLFWAPLFLPSLARATFNDVIHEKRLDTRVMAALAGAPICLYNIGNSMYDLYKAGYNPLIVLTSFALLMAPSLAYEAFRSTKDTRNLLESKDL